MVPWPSRVFPSPSVLLPFLCFCFLYRFTWLFYDDQAQVFGFQGFSEDGAHSVVGVVFFYGPDGLNTAGGGQVSNADDGSGGSGDGDAAVWRRLASGGAGTAVVQDDHEEVGLCGAGVDEGIDAAVVKGGVAQDGYGAFWNANFAEAGGHSDGGSHAEFGVQEAGGHDHATRVAGQKGVLTQGGSFFPEGGENFNVGATGAVGFAEGFFFFPFGLCVPFGWREAGEESIQGFLDLPAEEFAFARDVAGAFAQNARGNACVVADGFDAVFEEGVHFFQDEDFVTGFEEAGDEVWRQGVLDAEFQDGEVRGVRALECVL